MTLARFPLVLALACAALAAASGYGARVDLWDFRFGFRLLGWVPYAGLAAGALALLFALIPRIRAGNLPVLVLAFVVGCGVAYLPWQWRALARSVPAINDITTDPDNPPAFVAIIPLRAGASVPATYPGAAVAAAQRQAYPDIRPVELAVPPAAAFTRALDAARAAGWEIAAADPSAGRIEATATTPWFGFRDDVVVRIAATAAGSRVDVRSVSRLGKSDLGTNAKRIRAYLARLAG